MSALAAPLQRLFAWKVRGVRWVEIVGVLLVAAMIFSVYVAKAAAARTGSEISALEREIAENGRRVRLLRAEVARLERPARLEALSRDAGLAPVDVRRMASPEALPAIAPRPELRAAAGTATTAAPAAAVLPQVVAGAPASAPAPADTPAAPAAAPGDEEAAQ